MLSISGKNWIEINKNKRLLEKIKLDHNFEEIIAQIIISRKFTELEILTIIVFLFRDPARLNIN